MIVFGQHDEKTLAQLKDVSACAEHVALMADGHVGYIMPVDGVAAYRRGKPVREGKVSERMLADAVREAGVVLRGGGPDESPFVYRRLERVLAEQPGIEIVHRLRPLVVVMAGADELDPYRD